MAVSARVLCTIAVVVWAASAFAVPIDLTPGNFAWGVQHLVDQSQTVLGNSQNEEPRSCRGIGLSPDGRYVYAGYLFKAGNPIVRKIDTTVYDVVDAVVAETPINRIGKDIDTDDLGRVYLAQGANIIALDDTLQNKQLTIDTPGLTTDGVAVTREGPANTLVVYGTGRNTQELRRWEIDESVFPLVATPAGLTGGTGILDLSADGALDLRGCEVAPNGQVWMADIGAGQVFRVDPLSLAIASAAVPDAIDVGIDDGQVFVAQYDLRMITVLDAVTLGAIVTLTPDWLGLYLDGDGNASQGYGAARLSSIAVIPGRNFYVAHQGGQTLDEKPGDGESSRWGRNDGFSQYVGLDWFTAWGHDDNEPLLYGGDPQYAPPGPGPGPGPVFIPEPATCSLLLLAALPLLRRRRRD